MKVIITRLLSAELVGLPGSLKKEYKFSSFRSHSGINPAVFSGKQSSRAEAFRIYAQNQKIARELTAPSSYTLNRRLVDMKNLHHEDFLLLTLRFSPACIFCIKRLIASSAPVAFLLLSDIGLPEAVSPVLSSISQSSAACADSVFWQRIDTKFALRTGKAVPSPHKEILLALLILQRPVLPILFR